MKMEAIKEKLIDIYVALHFMISAQSPITLIVVGLVILLSLFIFWS